MTDEKIIDYILSILNGSKKEAVQMRECVAKTAICLNLNASIEFMQKLNTRLERLKGFESGEVVWQGDMNATIKQNLELKEQNMELKERCDRKTQALVKLVEQTEKMKCCGNCKHDGSDSEIGENGDYTDYTCIQCDDFSTKENPYPNWELTE